MAKLSARGRSEVFRLKKIWPDRTEDDDTKDSASWLSFRDDGVILKKVTWKSWNPFQERWESRTAGWSIWKRVGNKDGAQKTKERLLFWKETMMAAGWEEV